MQTLVIYDETGYIISQTKGSPLREPVGIPFIWVEIPQDKYLVSIDVSTEIHVPIFEDLPKSSVDIKISELEAQNAQMILALVEGGLL